MIPALREERAVAKASLNRACSEWRAIDAKRDDLPLVRVKAA